MAPFKGCGSPDCRPRGEPSNGIRRATTADGIHIGIHMLRLYLQAWFLAVIVIGNAARGDWGAIILFRCTVLRLFLREISGIRNKKS